MKKILLLILILNVVLAAPVFAEQKPAPNFDLPTLAGSRFVMADALTRKTVFINFWAAWCDSCAEEIGKLNELKNKYAANPDVIFIGINAGDSLRSATKFVDKTGFAYQILLDADKAVAKKFGVVGLPQSLVISKTGEIVYQNSVPPQALDSYIN